MNSMLIIASLIAVAVATPMHRGLVTPGGAGPAPIIVEPIAVGPTPIIDGPTAPIAVGPTPIIDDFSPIAIGPAFVDFEPIADVPAVELFPAIPTGTPLVQIILNINQAGQVVAPVVTETESAVIVPGPVNTVDGADIVSPVVVGTPEVVEVGPVNIVDAADIGSPVNVVEAAPIAVGTPVLPTVVEPVAVGTPILPAPVAVLPESLN